MNILNATIQLRRDNDYNYEKVKDFFDCVNGNGGNNGECLLLEDDIDVLNKILIDCGIKPIKEVKQNGKNW